MRRFFALLAAGVALLLGLPLPASANAKDDSIKKLDVEITLDESGTAHVKERFEWNFGDRQGLGFYRTITTAQGYDPEPNKYRVYEVSNEQVASPSGAPAQIWRESDSGGVLKLSVGAPDGSDDRVSGVQTYVLSYDLKGTINTIKDGKNAGLEEFYWNIFEHLDVRADAINVRISGPATVRDIACYQGPAGQDARCTTYRSAGQSATFTFGPLRAGDAATVMASFEGGTFANTAPILRDGRQRFLGLPPIAAIPAALIGVIAVWLAKRRPKSARDEAYLGVTPGVVSPSSPTGPVVQTPVTVQFTPPENLSPAEAQALLAASYPSKSLGVVVLDLATRGFIKISEVQRDAAGDPDDWAITLLPTPTPPEQEFEKRTLVSLNLHTMVFDGEKTVRVSALREKFHESATQIEESIADAMNKKKLFRRPLKDGSVSTLGVLAIVMIVGLIFYNGFSSLLALFRPPQLYFLPAIVALVAAGMIRAWRRSFPVFGRSAYGYALYKQTEGFREYLKTAEADQIIAESRQAEFSRYLPWAMAFGLEDLWAITMDHIAERTAVTAPNWYVGSDLSSFRDFADAAGSFSSTSADSMAYQPSTSGSSGGSGGFGGGSAGGGGGGGSAGGR